MIMFITFYFQMMAIDDSIRIWDSLVERLEAQPFNFAELESQYDVGKLQLEKITAHEIRSKRILFQTRSAEDDDQNTISWQENEYRIFMWFLLAYLKFYNRSPDSFSQQEWNTVGAVFQKLPHVCQYFYFSAKKKKSAAWTPEEDAIVEQLMRSGLSKKWTSIGLELYRLTKGKRIRKPKAIRQRWLSHLNPDIKKEGWTIDEELELVEKIREYGRRWSKIANVLGNRSEHMIKNRFHKLTLKLSKKQLSLDEYGQQEILDLIAKDLTHSKTEQKKPNPKPKSEPNIEQSLSLNSETIKSEAEQPTQTYLALKTGHIFNPTILIYAGFNVLQ